MSEVGHGKPPKHTRFKKGNPGGPGRPRKKAVQPEVSGAPAQASELELMAKLRDGGEGWWTNYDPTTLTHSKGGPASVWVQLRGKWHRVSKEVVRSLVRRGLLELDMITWGYGCHVRLTDPGSRQLAAWEEKRAVAS